MITDSELDTLIKNLYAALDWEFDGGRTDKLIEAFARAVSQATAERCAKIAEASVRFDEPRDNEVCNAITEAIRAQIPQESGRGEGGAEPTKLHFTPEWLAEKIKNDPDLETEAGVLHPEAPRPRFSIDHGVIHDRVTGRHVRTDEFETGIQGALQLLNSLAQPHPTCDCLYKGTGVVIPLADVQHVELHNPLGLIVVTGHTKWNREWDQWENNIWIDKAEADAFLAAWGAFKADSLAARGKP